MQNLIALHTIIINHFIIKFVVFYLLQQKKLQKINDKGFKCVH